MALGTAGCLGDDDDDPRPRSDHPATDDVDGPRLGPAVGDAAATIVAFEDPSCATCARFATDTFPVLVDEAIDPGHVTYLWRANLGVEPWGRPATRALFAIYDREPAAFWELKERYYAEREGMDEQSVRELTHAFLEETDVTVDPDAVSEAIDGDDEAVTDRIAGDEAAAAASELELVPSYVLFRDAEYVSVVAGNQPYEVFEGALDL